eukprot:6073844-Amphidinium_carterae.1
MSIVATVIVQCEHDQAQPFVGGTTYKLRALSLIFYEWSSALHRPNLCNVRNQTANPDTGHRNALI